MRDEQIEYGIPQEHRNASDTRVIKHSIELYHKGLNEHKSISAPGLDILWKKADCQVQAWGAIEALKKIDNLLIHTLRINFKENRDGLKKNEKYPEIQPSKPFPHPKKIYGVRPAPGSPEFSSWELKKNMIGNFNAQVDKKNEEELRKWNIRMSKWEEKKNIFLKQQEEFNSKIVNIEKAYLHQDADSIVEYCNILLNYSEYPESFPKKFEIEYNPANKILIIEYELPSIECLPKIKEVKYIVATRELKETYIPESQLQKMFDDAMYKITLRTIHELFEADVANAIEAISFNGWVRTISKATGKKENNCILSIQVKKSEFLEIDLSYIDPKTCFRHLKGVASSKLSSLTPVQPILQINKADKRFVEGYDVANQIDNATNLAAMDWEDFEHLIRELFEKEFQSNGGEVKVTQASRDGGVDAIAFDPDPIRGGKIVIQAKRYTNTVGVSAVRDLFGTVMNEGATKGILVSTADYGPDAYEFAKGKPLTLLSGSNLLYLLEKHGHHAKIDLREAKKILSEKGK